MIPQWQILAVSTAKQTAIWVSLALAWDSISGHLPEILSVG